MRRLTVIVGLILLLAGCGEAKPPPGQGTNSSSIRVTEVEMRGRTYDCIVYDRKDGYAGMGGLWCEGREP